MVQQIKVMGCKLQNLLGYLILLIERASDILSQLEQKEENLFKNKEIETQSTPEPAINLAMENSAVDEQLSLFGAQKQEAEGNVIESLRKANILNLTPLEAINLLNELQNELK